METLGVTVIKELGRGTSGVVYKVQSHEDGTFKVIKTIDLSSLSTLKQMQAEKEVSILKKVDHSHIIKYYNNVAIDEILYILMEFASGGDLQSLIALSKQKHQYISENQIWAWTYELCLAVNYLHSHKILHRDIKCMNIFLDNKNRIKLGDLGLSEFINENTAENRSMGTPLFMSPEQIRHQPYGFKVDVWAIGCVIYSLCSLESPFSGDNLITLGHNITTLTPKPLPPRYSPNLQTLVSMLLEKDQNLRPKIKEVIRCIPASTKTRYKKPLENYNPERVIKTEILPVIVPQKTQVSKTAVDKSAYITHDYMHGLTVSARKFNISDTPELPRSISRNLNKSRSRTTVSDLMGL